MAPAGTCPAAGQDRDRRPDQLFPTRGGPFTALDGISLDIPRGNFCTIRPDPPAAANPRCCASSLGSRPHAGRAAIVADDPTKPLNAMVFRASRSSRG